MPFSGPIIESLGHRPPRDQDMMYTSIQDPNTHPVDTGDTEETTGDIVVLSNGRVSRVMKIFEIHLFAFAVGKVTLHVRTHNSFCLVTECCLDAKGHL